MREKENEAGHSFRVPCDITLRELKERACVSRRLDPLKYRMYVMKTRQLHESVEKYSKWTLNECIRRFQLQEVAIYLKRFHKIQRNASICDVTRESENVEVRRESKKNVTDTSLCLYNKVD
eukprot:TRINITY_DN406_c0_g1_i3.p3 TRINITY_DN406_c0_g1~~TRINITY_DN406_c0_g1_i3.p3  ORF type:complete len:121 (+),score=30.49 TRINITY_DN406_c0_g1_i3:583-945(+)